MTSTTYLSGERNVVMLHRTFNKRLRARKHEGKNEMIISLPFFKCFRAAIMFMKKKCKKGLGFKTMKIFAKGGFDEEQVMLFWLSFWLTLNRYIDRYVISITSKNRYKLDCLSLYNKVNNINYQRDSNYMGIII